MVLYLLAPAIISWNNKKMCMLCCYVCVCCVGFQGNTPWWKIIYCRMEKRDFAVCIVYFVSVCMCVIYWKYNNKKNQTNKSIHNPQQAMFATNEWCSGHLGHKQMLDGFVLFVYFYLLLHDTNCNNNLLVNCVCIFV